MSHLSHGLMVWLQDAGGSRNWEKHSCRAGWRNGKGVGKRKKHSELVVRALVPEREQAIEYLQVGRTPTG